MTKHPAWALTLVSLAALLWVLLTGCGPSEQLPEPAPAPSRVSQGPSVAQRWDAMADEEEKRVCAATSGPLPGEGEIGGAGSQSDGVDYRKVLWELEAAGFSQNEAAAMLPHALKECR